jgi:hypothetical protein
MNTLSASAQKNLNDWRRAYAQCELMHQWAFDVDAQADLREEVGRERCVPDWLMVSVHSRRNWYLQVHPSAIYLSLEAYIVATRAALDADVLAYQAEVSAAEDAHRKRRREALKAERAAAPPVPERAQPARASKRARDVFLLKGLRSRAGVFLCPLCSLSVT